MAHEAADDAALLRDENMRLSAVYLFHARVFFNSSAQNRSFLITKSELYYYSGVMRKKPLFLSRCNKSGTG